MRRITRGETAAGTFHLGLGLSIAGAVSLLHIPAVAWLLEHPAAIGTAVTAISGILGYGLKRVPQFQITERTHVHQQDRVHRRIESVIDALAYIQAECDTAADHAKAARQIAQKLQGGNT